MKKVLFVCAPGGHLVAALKIARRLDVEEIIFSVHDLNDKKVENWKNFPVINCNRGIKNLVQFYQAFFIIIKQKPSLIISTGSSIAVNFFLLAQFFKIKTIYVESPTRVIEPSKTLKIVQYLADRVYVRSKHLKKYNHKFLYLENLK